MIVFLKRFLVSIIAYFIGAFPVGFWVARLRGIQDIRTKGSGNIGATNVGRFLGTRYFFLVFLLDALKAYAYLWLLNYFGFDDKIMILASIMLLIGNSHSIFLQGTGGKGVATSFGILLALMPHIAFLVLFLWIFGLALTRNIGIASVVATVLLPFCAWHFSYDFNTICFLLFLALWVMWRHWQNIREYFSLNDFT